MKGCASLFFRKDHLPANQVDGSRPFSYTSAVLAWFQAHLWPAAALFFAFLSNKPNIL